MNARTLSSLVVIICMTLSLSLLSIAQNLPPAVTQKIQTAQKHINTALCLKNFWKCLRIHFIHHFINRIEYSLCVWLGPVISI